MGPAAAYGLGSWGPSLGVCLVLPRRAGLFHPSTGTKSPSSESSGSGSSLRQNQQERNTLILSIRKGRIRLRHAWAQPLYVRVWGALKPRPPKSRIISSANPAQMGNGPLPLPQARGRARVCGPGRQGASPSSLLGFLLPPSF